MHQNCVFRAGHLTTLLLSFLIHRMVIKPCRAPVREKWVNTCKVLRRVPDTQTNLSKLRTIYYLLFLTVTSFITMDVISVKLGTYDPQYFYIAFLLYPFYIVYWNVIISLTKAVFDLSKSCQKKKKKSSWNLSILLLMYNFITSHCKMLFIFVWFLQVYWYFIISCHMLYSFCFFSTYWDI